jgi:hypothetical protein
MKIRLSTKELNFVFSLKKPVFWDYSHREEIGSSGKYPVSKLHARTNCKVQSPVHAVTREMAVVEATDIHFACTKPAHLFWYSQKHYPLKHLKCFKVQFLKYFIGLYYKLFTLYHSILITKIIGIFYFTALH